MDFKSKSTSEYKNISSEETLKFLETSTEGLTESEVRNRLKRFGYNEIVERRKNLFLEFLSPLLGSHAVASGAGDGALVRTETLS